MNPEMPQKPQDELEASLTALLLGELPHEQAAVLHQKLAQDTELAKLYDRLKHTVSLVRETVTGPTTETAAPPAPLRLSEQRRQKLLERFKTVAPKEFARPPRRPVRWLVPVGIAAALAVVLGGLFLPALSRSKSRGQSLGFHTWSLSEEANSAMTAPAAAEAPPSEPIEQRHRLMQPSQSAVSEAKPEPAAKVESPPPVLSEPLPPPPAASAVIALPQSSELADATTTPPAAGDDNSWSARAANRGIYDVTLDRLGGVRTGSAPGSLAGSAYADASAPEGQQKQSAAADSFVNAGAMAPGLAQDSPLEQREQANTQPVSGETITRLSASGGAGGAPAPLGLQAAVADKEVISETKRLPSRQPPPAFKGTPKDAPALGDIPAMGRLFQSELKPAQALMTPPSSETVNGNANKGFAWNFDSGNANLNRLERTYAENPTAGAAQFSLDPQASQTINLSYATAANIGEALTKLDAAKGKAGGPDISGANAYDLGVAGYVNGALTATNGIAEFPAEHSTTESHAFYRLLPRLGTDANGASRRAESPIVLPQAQPEASVVLQDRHAADQRIRQLASAAGESGGRLNDLEIVNGTAGRMNGNTPKAPASGNATELMQRRRIAELGRGEPDEGKKVPPAAPVPIPQPEAQTADNAFSTFSLNVSDVSFKLAAASLEKGVMPEPGTVRSEEFINAFDYRDPEPPPGVPVAFAWERAQYPFAQNRDLLRFSIKTAALGRQPGRPLNLVLLLDNSGSMERADRVQIIHAALRVLARQLQPQDTFSVVTFARTAHLWVDGVPGNQAAQVAEEVSGLTPQGGTNLEDAMNLAYQTALRHYLANGVNRVVLLTDGAANLGNVDPEALKQKVEATRKQGIALDCFGIGWEGYNDDLLEVLSRNGDGRYAFLNSPEEVTSEFAAKLAGALQVAASDVKVQVEFNPARVTAYRQIGYAKHQLTKEQFRDNTVNAAQIGAAEAGNALYTVEVNPAGTGPLCTVRVRFRIPGTADYREHAWEVPFNGNAVALEQASPAMRLAATASAFSEWLASSPYAGEVTPDRLLSYLTGVPEVYGADARPKKLEWMIRQAKSIAGK